MEVFRFQLVEFVGGSKDCVALEVEGKGMRVEGELVVHTRAKERYTEISCVAISYRGFGRRGK